jgi:hypothetical protein
MAEYEPALSPADEMLRGFLEQGLRPAEIAVRLGIPMADVHARIARLAGRVEPLAPETPAQLASPPVSPVDGTAEGHEHEPGSHVPLVLLGIVAAVFVAAMAVFLVLESREAGQRTSALDREGGSIPPAIVQPTPSPTPTPIVIDGVQLESMTLGAPVEFPRGVAVMVWSTCIRCQPVVTYVQGPLGLESYPSTFDLPPEARVFTAAATPDGATVVVNAGWDDGSAIFRSNDAGVTWTEVWRGAPGWGIRRVGPDHVAISHFDTDQVKVIPGDLEFAPDEPQLLALTPLSVFRTIEPAEEIEDREFGIPRVWSQDRDHYVTNLLPDTPTADEPVILGDFDPEGTLLRGWTGGAVLPVGAVLAERVFLSAALTEAGVFADSDDDESFLSAALFDLDTGTLHVLELPERPPNSLQFIVSVREGPFLRVPEGSAGCLPVRAAVGDRGDPLLCAAPNTLLRDTGGRGALGVVQWAEVEAPGGVRGWVPLSDVIFLPR